MTTSDLATAVAAELERREAERMAHERAQAAIQRVAALNAREAEFRGGPCRFCGVERSAGRILPSKRFPRGAEYPRWIDGNVCTACDSERRPLGSLISDIEHRERVVRSLVSADMAKLWWGSHIVTASDFHWWEYSGASGGGVDRWAYLDIPAMTERLSPKRTSPPYQTLRPCSVCGCADRWLPRPPEAPMTSPTGKVIPYLSGPTHFCAACTDYGDSPAEIRANIVRKILGMSPFQGVEREMDTRTGTWRDGTSLVEMLGPSLPLWKDSGKPAPDVPFGYLDLRKLKIDATLAVRGQRR